MSSPLVNAGGGSRSRSGGTKRCSRCGDFISGDTAWRNNGLCGRCSGR